VGFGWFVAQGLNYDSNTYQSAEWMMVAILIGGGMYRVTGGRTLIDHRAGNISE